MSELDEYLNFAKDLAIEAGKIFERYFRAEDIDVTIKQDNTPVTAADTAINNLVIEKVKAQYPDHGVLGEEDSYETDRQFLWVVDPIDGTIPFSLGIPVSTFLLALVDKTDGQPIVAVIYEPYLKRIYTAITGGGAFLNDQSIRVSDLTDLKNTYVSVSEKFGENESSRVIDGINKAGGKNFALFSGAYTAMMVASGEFVGTAFSYGSPWDAAASALIITEAGGIATDIEGKPRRYDEFGNGAVQSNNQQIHDQLLRCIKNANNRN